MSILLVVKSRGKGLVLLHFRIDVSIYQVSPFSPIKVLLRRELRISRNYERIETALCRLLSSPINLTVF